MGGGFKCILKTHDCSDDQKIQQNRCERRGRKDSERIQNHLSDCSQADQNQIGPHDLRQDNGELGISPTRVQIRNKVSINEGGSRTRLR